MPESLRMRVVEAGARAIYLSKDSTNEWHWENTAPQEKYRRQMSVALDAMLGCLAENADEWMAWVEAGDDFGEAADKMLAVLREDR